MVIWPVIPIECHTGQDRAELDRKCNHNSTSLRHMYVFILFKTIQSLVSFYLLIRLIIIVINFCFSLNVFINVHTSDSYYENHQSLVLRTNEISLLLYHCNVHGRIISLFIICYNQGVGKKMGWVNVMTILHGFISVSCIF